MAIADQVKTIIAQELDVDAGKVIDTASLFDDLRADELERLQLVMSIEEALGIEIGDDAIERLVTVGDVVKCVEGLAA